MSYLPNLLHAERVCRSTRKGRARWSNRWKAALNAFDITFDGRVFAGRG